MTDDFYERKAGREEYSRLDNLILFSKRVSFSPGILWFRFPVIDTQYYSLEEVGGW